MALRIACRRLSITATAAAAETKQLGKVESKIKELGLALPPPSPNKVYHQFVPMGKNVAYISGHLPQPAEGPLVVGKVGKEVTLEQGYEAAKLVGLNLISTLKANVKDLDKIKRITKLTGFVNCIDGFTQQPQVVNGCSELLVKVFGEAKGSHARSAVGVGSLPLGVPVEVEMIVEFEE